MMSRGKIQIRQHRLICLVIFVSLLWVISAKANLSDKLEQLKQAYSKQIQSVNENYITWFDGTKMPVQDGKPHKSFQEKLNSPSLADQLEQVDYPEGASFHINGDPGRIRYEPFFRKMYGNSRSEVKRNLTVIYWMPKIFGGQYPVEVTTVNSVYKKLSQVSDELEELVLNHPEFRKYLENPGGFFNWRFIANTNRLSLHSFGVSIDINIKYSNYWQWDLKKEGLPIIEMIPLTYKNQIPWEIVEIFEKNGFIWGGKWYHYDTMHFEYRPELLIK